MTKKQDVINGLVKLGLKKSGNEEEYTILKDPQSGWVAFVGDTFWYVYDETNKLIDEGMLIRSKSAIDYFKTT